MYIDLSGSKCVICCHIMLSTCVCDMYDPLTLSRLNVGMFSRTCSWYFSRFKLACILVVTYWYFSFFITGLNHWKAILIRNVRWTSIAKDSCIRIFSRTHNFRNLWKNFSKSYYFSWLRKFLHNAQFFFEIFVFRKSLHCSQFFRDH